MDKKIQKKRWTGRKIGLILISLIGTGFLTNAIYHESGTSRLNVDKARIQIDTIKRNTFQEYIPVTGIVLPIKSVIISAVEGGQVKAKFAEEGAILKVGTPVVQLSNPDLQMDYLNQEANVVSQINQIRMTSLIMEQQSLNLKETALEVEYQIDLFSKRVRRNQELFDDGAVSQVDFEESEDEYENFLKRRALLTKTIEQDSLSGLLQQQQMQNSLKLMERNLGIAKQSLENLIIKAPIEGQLSGFVAELGELIPEGSQVAQIDDLSNFKIRVRIDEFYISRVFTGQEGAFEFAGNRFELQIQKIYPQVENGSFEADMIFIGVVPNGIKRGQSVTIKLELSAQEDALLLARGGFYQSTGGNWVYVVDPDNNIARKREIKVGRQNPNYYEVLDGLYSNDLVIISNYDGFGDKDELILR